MYGSHIKRVHGIRTLGNSPVEAHTTLHRDTCRPASIDSATRRHLSVTWTAPLTRLQELFFAQSVQILHTTVVRKHIELAGWEENGHEPIILFFPGVIAIRIALYRAQRAQRWPSGDARRPHN